MLGQLQGDATVLYDDSHGMKICYYIMYMPRFQDVFHPLWRAREIHASTWCLTLVDGTPIQVHEKLQSSPH
jgi:hypothetical protein